VPFDRQVSKLAYLLRAFLHVIFAEGVLAGVPCFPEKRRRPSLLTASNWISEASRPAA